MKLTVQAFKEWESLVLPSLSKEGAFFVVATLLPYSHIEMIDRKNLVCIAISSFPVSEDTAEKVVSELIEMGYATKLDDDTLVIGEANNKMVTSLYLYGKKTPDAVPTIERPRRIPSQKVVVAKEPTPTEHSGTRGDVLREKLDPLVDSFEVYSKNLNVQGSVLSGVVKILKKVLKLVDIDAPITGTNLCEFLSVVDTLVNERPYLILDFTVKHKAVAKTLVDQFGSLKALEIVFYFVSEYVPNSDKINVASVSALSGFKLDVLASMHKTSAPKRQKQYSE